MASGGPIDPFWSMYSNHMTHETFDLLENYRIGNLIITDENPIISDDPYANDPSRLPVFRVNSQKPFNAEPPLDLLINNFITPNEIHYVRNHLPVPLVDTHEYALIIEGLGVKSTKLTLEDIKTKFPIVKVTVAIQCAGNRRSEMNKVKQVKGLEWSGGAIGNAEWTGVRLRDLLNYVGIDSTKGIEHIQFEGLDKDMTNQAYGSSIPFQKGYSEEGDVIIAFQMNGKDIPRDHGFPIRAIVPGVVGARSVKWLSKIVLSKEESQSFWQQNDYKGFSPSIDFSNADYKKSIAIQELPIQSQICSPLNHSVVKRSDETVVIKGYAWSGGGKQIAWVDVSIDGGKTWKIAKIDKPLDEKRGKAWSWTPWEIEVEIPKGQKEFKVISKAVDENYNVQPERIDPIWNIRGVLTNSWSTVHLQVDEDEDLKVNDDE